MSDFIFGALALILRGLYAALDVFVTIDRLKQAARLATGSDKLVEVPPDPKPLPPAAERALAEAEARRTALPDQAGRKPVRSSEARTSSAPSASRNA